MGKFSKLLEMKGKNITLGDEVYNIKPLTGKYIGLFMDLDGSNKHNAMIQIMLASLRQTDAMLTEDDISELPFTKLTELMKIIMEVNEVN